MQISLTLKILILLVVLAPLASSLLSLITPERYSWSVIIMAPLFLLISASISLYLFFSLSQNSSFVLQGEWFRVGHHAFDISFEINRLSILMVPLVSIISFLVHLYSVGYMVGEKGIRRYFSMLGFFTFSMLGIVLANDLLLIFIFWELVGFSSYMLIGHWLEKPAAAKAAQKAFIFNRIGDAGFLIGIMIVWTHTQNLNLSSLLHLSEIYSWQTAATLCIFCGVIGKSAQLPLFTWLPEAMEGPIPVSALIHAATMVVAGVFLLARVFPLFTTTTLNVVAITGSITALAGALCALNQYDIKKILAYSTISQLGLMVTAVGVGSANAAMFHLFTHAFFKAGLFLAAGAIIYSLQHSQLHVHNHVDTQDIRNLGGLRKKLPFTFFVFLICAAALAGIPFSSGFTSKDSILTATWLWAGNSFSWQWLILILIFSVSLITVLYTFRLVWFVFFGKENNPQFSVIESPWIMRVPLIVLAFSSFWFIASMSPIHASGWFTVSIGDLPHSNFVTILSITLIVLGLIVSWFIYTPAHTKPQSVFFFQNGLKADFIYKRLFGQSTMKLAIATEYFDRKWIDGLIHFSAYGQVSIAHIAAWFDTYIIDGLAKSLVRLSGTIGSITRSMQGGKIQLYIFWATMGVIIFLIFALI